MFAVYGLYLSDVSGPPRLLGLFTDEATAVRIAKDEFPYLWIVEPTTLGVPEAPTLR